MQYRRKKMAVKRFKIRFFTLTDTQLNMYHDAEHLKHSLCSLDLRGYVKHVERIKNDLNQSMHVGLPDT